MILKYFGYILDGCTLLPIHKCCDYHKDICDCEDCSVELVNEVDLALKDIVLGNTTPSDCQEVDLTQLRDELTSYWLNLHYGRSCIGSTCFSSGYSIELIELVCSSFDVLNSFDDVMTMMPVFTKNNAIVIWEVLKKYK
jgi:hypothetical protein